MCPATQNQRLVGFSSLRLSFFVWCDANMVSQFDSCCNCHFIGQKNVIHTATDSYPHILYVCSVLKNN